VGTILGLTGNNSVYGQFMLRGFGLAVDEINDSGGIAHRRLDLVVEDSQFDPIKAVSAFRRLNAAEGIRLIVGITGSKNALAVCEAARNDSDILIIDALGSAPALTDSCGGRDYVRIMPSDAFAGAYNVNWALASGMKRPAIVYEEDEWGASYRDALLNHLRAKGFTNVAMEGVPPGGRDFRVEVEKLAQFQPDVVFILLYANDGAGFMREYRQANLRGTVYGSDNISTTEFVSAGAAAIEGVRVALPTSASGRRYDRLEAAYRTRYGSTPDSDVIKAYDAMELAAKAIAAVGPDPARIRSYLLSPSFKFDGASGFIRFDSHGDLIGQEYSRMIYSRGKLVPF